MFDMWIWLGGEEVCWMNRGSDARIDEWIYPHEEIFFQFYIPTNLFKLIREFFS